MSPTQPHLVPSSARVLLSMAGEGIGAGVMPDIAAIASKPAELDIVAMRPAALRKHRDELVLDAIERAMPGLCLTQTHTFLSSP